MLFFLGLVAVPACGPSLSSPRVPAVARDHPQPGVTLAAQLSEAQVVTGQLVDVPVYSTIASADHPRPINLATTLTIRNLDQGRPIVVEAIRYYDSGGHLVRNSLDQPIRFGPLAAFDRFVHESDNSRGASPSFLVDWDAEGEIANPPLVQAVMISTAGSQGITLTSSGRVLATNHP